jgi:SAM-dependent methyltransferase
MTPQTLQERPTSEYDVESYWSRVAGQIAARGEENVVAGDDDPFWRYKRQKFLTTFLHDIDFDGVTALELGCGPGGNLLEVARAHAPAKLIGVDISAAMIGIAARNLARHNVVAELHKIDGAHLPFADRSIDLAYTVTVLQHNTDSTAFESLCGELCRVTGRTMVLVEDTGSGVKTQSGSFVARPIEAYATALSRHGFQLTESRRLNIRVSGLAHAVVHRLFVTKDRKEGDPVGWLPQMMLRTALPLTRVADSLVTESAGLTKMTFQRDGR